MQENEQSKSEKARESRRKYTAANQEKVKASRKAWADANKDKRAGYHLKEKYGLTPAAYDALYQKAEGKCEICAAPGLSIFQEGKVGDKLCVDHCHTTGAIRGMLCHHCNRCMAIVDNHKAGIERYLKKAVTE